MTKKTNNPNNDFEQSLKKSLKSLGYMFPTTDDQVDFFERTNVLEKMPETFPGSDEIINRTKVISIIPKQNESGNPVIENLARAARKGNSIPANILKKMQEDRDKARENE